MTEQEKQTPSEQLKQLITLAEEFGYSYFKDSGFKFEEIDFHNEYIIVSIVTDSFEDDREINVERVFFDPELSFIKALCKMKYPTIFSNEQELLGAAKDIATRLLFSSNRIEYLAKTFL